VGQRSNELFATLGALFSLAKAIDETVARHPVVAAAGH
jgi:hypothetical protein